MVASTMIRQCHRLFLMLVILLTGSVLMMLSGCQPAAPAIANNRLHLTIAGQSFHLEIAATPQQQYQGLSDRQRIDPDGGMIFIQPRPQVLTFVMRRCKVPIDIIFLDGSGRIVSMHVMEVEPYDRPDSQLKPYSSQWPAQFAIELAGGTLKKLNLHTGDHIPLPLADLKKLVR